LPISDGDGTPKTLVGETVKDEDGVYLFDSLPNGTYTVVLPMGPNGGMTPSSVADAGDTNEDVQNGTSQPDGSVASEPFDLVAGTEPSETGALDGDDQDDAGDDMDGNMTIDFGFQPTMSIGSTVFYDVDDSGDQDMGNPLESGIAGATVNLYFDADGNGVVDGAEATTPIDMTVTDADGNYLFDTHAPGVYVVGVVPADDAETASSTQSVADDQQLEQALDLTGYFLNACVFHPLNRGEPGARTRFVDRYRKLTTISGNPETTNSVD